MSSSTDYLSRYAKSGTTAVKCFIDHFLSNKAQQQSELQKNFYDYWNWIAMTIILRKIISENYLHWLMKTFSNKIKIFKIR